MNFKDPFSHLPSPRALLKWQNISKGCYETEIELISEWHNLQLKFPIWKIRNASTKRPMYNNSKWFSFFHNFKMKVNKMPSLKYKKKKRAREDTEAYWLNWALPRVDKKDLRQILSPKDAMARTCRVMADVRTLRAGCLTCRSEHSQLRKMKVSERKRMKQAFQGQWKLFYLLNRAIHVKKKMCVCMCVYQNCFFLLNINYMLFSKR